MGRNQKPDITPFRKREGHIPKGPNESDEDYKNRLRYEREQKSKDSGHQR